MTGLPVRSRLTGAVKTHLCSERKSSLQFQYIVCAIQQVEIGIWPGACEG